MLCGEEQLQILCLLKDWFTANLIMNEDYVGILDLLIPIVAPDTEGVAIFDCDGRIETVCVRHTGACTYEYVIRDADGFGVTARRGLSNNVVVSEDKPVFGRNAFSLTNVNDPGEYHIRIRGKIRGKQIS